MSDDENFDYEAERLSATLPEFITLLDESRLDALGEDLDPGLPWAELNHENVKKYITLALCGVQDGVDAAQYDITFDDDYADVFDDERCQVMKDVDSALIFGAKFFFLDNYDIFSTFDTRFTLGEHLHCRVPFTNPLDPEEIIYRDPGEDTAVLWGVCGIAGRDRMHIMIPGAANESLLEMHTAIYAANLLAAKEALPDVVKQWSPDYQTELSRTGFWSPFTRRPTRSKRSIRAGVIDEVTGVYSDGALFGKLVMDHIRTYEWGQHAYWFLQIRGAKDLTRHTGGARHTGQWIENLLTFVHEPSCAIYLDMAVELHLPPGYSSLVARGEDAFEGMADALFGIQPAMFDEFQIEPDVWAGLQKAAGYRVDFADDPVTDHKICYLQAYGTDKFQTYNMSSNSSKSMKLYPKSAFSMKNADDIPVSYPLVYHALLVNLDAKTPGAVRAEVRVPRSQAQSVFTQGMEPRDFQPYVHILKNQNLWAWRLHKICACLLLLRYAASARKDTRANTDTLLLVAAVCFVFNSMHARPMEMAWDRQLAGQIFPTGSISDNSENKDLMIYEARGPHWQIPLMFRGAMWLPPLIFPATGVGDVLRFRYSATIRPDDKLIATLFNMKMHEIESRYGKGLGDATLKGSTVLPKRNVKPAKMIPKRTVILPQGVVDLDIPAIRKWMDAQPDLPPERVEFDHSDPNLKPTTAAHLFLALISGVIQKCGQVKELEVCKLSPEERQRVGFGTFQDMNLSTYFTTFMWQKNMTRWSGMRKRLIPGLDDEVTYGQKQGWKNMPAFHLLLALREHLRTRNPAIYIKLHTFLCTCFDSLKWFLWSEKDRNPCTKWAKKPGFTKLYPTLHFPQEPTTGIIIILNPLTAGDVTALTQPAILDPRPVAVDPEAALQRAHQATLPALFGAASDLIHREEEEESDQELGDDNVADRSDGGYDQRDLPEPVLPTEEEAEFAANRLVGWTKGWLPRPKVTKNRSRRVPTWLRYQNEEERPVIQRYDLGHEVDVIQE